MLYQLSYFRISLLAECGRRWIRTTEGINQQIYSLPHLATLVFALSESDRQASLGRLSGSFLISECKVKHFFVTHQMFWHKKSQIFLEI